MERVSSISVPTGGAALRGTGETLEADPASGTLATAIPLDLPAAAGLTPDVALRYSSTAGNGIAGMGWSLGLPVITRRTDRGVPTHTGSDSFVLSGSEELIEVPLDGASVADLPSGAHLTRYRPRTDIEHARILRITGAGNDYWEVWTGDGWRQRYGTRRPEDAPGTWVDPATAVRPRGGTHAWSLTRRWDTHTGEIVIDHERDPGGVVLPRTLRYGRLTGDGYAVTVTFTYEPRPDIVTDRRPGFPLTLTRRLARIDVSSIGSSGAPMRTTRLGYRESPGGQLSLLNSVRVSGTGADGSIQRRAPLTFDYTAWEPTRQQFRLLEESMPPGPVGVNVQLLDLFGDGLPSVVTSEPAPRYRRGLGHGRFDLPRTLTGLPSSTATGTAFEDVDGDGRPELYLQTGTGLAVYALAAPGPQAGFDPIPLTRQATAPPIGQRGREIDLEGRHVRDLVLAGVPPLLARADGSGGFEGLRPLSQAPPPLSAADDPRVRLADMTGDGLTDVVLVEDGRVTYWPSLGHGTFDAPLRMSGAPRIGGAGGLDHTRVLLGDLTGDGSADLVHVGDGTVTVWLNRCGRGFAPPLVLRGMPRGTAGASASLVDLVGTGVRGILWTGVGTGARWAWLDLTGGTKPYLLCTVDNGVGSRTEVSWSTSTAYALADRAAGQPWRTTLPFPVHVVAATTRTERFSGTTQRHTYAYHDGCWDPVERELRGFGRVEVTEWIGPPRNLPAPIGRVQPLDPLTPRTALPGDVDPAAHGNLLTDWSFDDADSDAWGEVTRAASTLPAGHTGQMAVLGPEARLAQSVPATGPVIATAWVRVRSGSVTLSVGEATLSTGPTDDWVLLELPARVAGLAEVRLSTLGDDADADVDHVWLRRAPEHEYPSGHVVTTSWFHLGPVPRARGQWSSYDDSQRYFSADPPLLAPVSGPTFERSAMRTLRGRPARREVRVVDPTADQQRTHSVEEHSYQVVAVAPGCWSVRTLATRTTEWDGSEDPRTTVTAHGGFDELDRPRHSLTLGVPRGRDPHTGGAPVMGTVSTTDWCLRDDTLLLRTDLPARTIRRAIDDPGTGGIPELVQEVLSGEHHGELLGATWQHYDGEPFVGLPRGQLGEYGLTAATHALALTQERIDALTAPTSDYQDGLPWPGLWSPNEHGYTWIDDGELSGWAVSTTRTRFDARGLPVETIDACGGRTHIDWDQHGLLPVAVTDAAGLRTNATLDLRLITHDSVTDPNGALTTITRTPLGLLAGIARVGRPDDGEGDDPTLPGTVHEYLLDPPEGQPMSVTTRTRVDFTAAASDADEVVVTTYLDGMHRVLQTRTTADTSVLENLGLDGNPGNPAGPPTRRTDRDRVVIADECRRDDRGQAVLTLTPRFGQGHGYSPLQQQDWPSAPLQCSVRDVLGRILLDQQPDGTIKRTGHPSPWLTEQWDTVCASSIPTRQLDQSHRWGVGEITEVDPLGRPVRHTSTLADRSLTVTQQLDLDGRPLAVSDRTGGTAIRHRYDLLGRAWLRWTPSGGTTWSALDGLGAVVESRDARGAVVVTVHDRAHRPVLLQSADTPDGQRVTRVRTRYGDEPGFSVPYGRGRVVEVHDDAGVTHTLAYRFDGMPRQVSRQVVSASTIIDDQTRSAEGPGTWGAEQLADSRSDVLTHDALGRVLACTSTLSGGRVIITEQEWDRTGALQRVVSDGVEQLAWTARDARGLLTAAQVGDLLHRWVRDPATGRLRRRHACRGSTIVQDETRRWDAGGALTDMDLRHPACGTRTQPDRLVRRFSRDPLGRLTRATGRESDRPSPRPWDGGPRVADLTVAREYRQSYVYTDDDVLTTMTHHATDAPQTGWRRDMDVDPVTRRLTSLRCGSYAAAYEHDAAGQVIAEGMSREFTWDALGRLVGAATTDGDGKASVRTAYRYAADGTRVIRVVRALGRPTEVTLELGDVERVVLVHPDRGPEAFDEQHLSTGELPLTTRRLGAVWEEAHLRDHPVLQTLRGEEGATLVLSEQGETLAWEDYTPYGETSFGGHQNRRYRYRGRPRDPVTGAQQFGARQYAPWLGRWLSVDPAGPVDGPNLYGYARCDPISYGDPTGLAAREQDDTAPSPSEQLRSLTGEVRRSPYQLDPESLLGPTGPVMRATPPARRRSVVPTDLMDLTPDWRDAVLEPAAGLGSAAEHQARGVETVRGPGRGKAPKKPYTRWYEPARAPWGSQLLKDPGHTQDQARVRRGQVQKLERFARGLSRTVFWLGAGIAGYDQWKADAQRDGTPRALGDDVKKQRALVVFGTTAVGAYVGEKIGAGIGTLASAETGPMAVIPGAVGSAIGSYIGSAYGEAVGRWFNDHYLDPTTAPRVYVGGR